MIRNVTLSDAAAIAEIYNPYVLESTVSFEKDALSVEEMQKRIAEISSAYPYYVEERCGKIIGYACVHPWKERAAYGRTLETTVYVSPDCKGRGVGRKLMEKIIKDCKERGFRALIACITAENSESRAFHERLGFQQVSCFKNVGEKFGRVLDVVDYELELTD